MKCVNHPDKDAVAMCVSCGVGLCHDCRKVVRGASFCEECATTHQPMMVHPGRAGTGINFWAIVAWVLSVAGWPPGAEFLSVAGVLLAFIALGDMRLRGEQQQGRFYAYAAIACGGVVLLIKVGLLVYMMHYGLVTSPWLNPFKYFGPEGGG